MTYSSPVRGGGARSVTEGRCNTITVSAEARFHRPSDAPPPRAREDLSAAVAQALSTVYDPCSIAAGRPTSLVDMGLVLDAHMNGNTLHVTFCVTFAGCTMAPHFIEAARVELAKIEGVKRVETRVDTAHVWEPRTQVPMRGVPQAWRQSTRA